MRVPSWSIPLAQWLRNHQLLYARWVRIYEADTSAVSPQRPTVDVEIFEAKDEDIRRLAAMVSSSPSPRADECLRPSPQRSRRRPLDVAAKPRTCPPRRCGPSGHTRDCGSATIVRGEWTKRERAFSHQLPNPLSFLPRCATPVRRMERGGGLSVRETFFCGRRLVGSRTAGFGGES